MLAFSYIRFSSKKQELSDSLRRQTDLSKAYAERNGLTLSDQSFEDLGVSAFKGLNADAARGGGLGLFLRAVDEGLIPNNCYLLVESLDRVSRATVDEALELFLSIIRRGITIVSLIDNQKFSQETIQADRGIGLIISITSFIRAHEESVVKSTRIAAAWTNKRKNQKILTRICPGWLKVSEDKQEYLLIPEKVELVQRIFQQSLYGKGTVSIARELNDDGIPLLSGMVKVWTPANVAFILKNHAVYGLYIPHKAKNVAPVENQFPVIVSKEDFDRVQELTQSRSAGRRTTTNEVGNLWGKISFCRKCGFKFKFRAGKSKTSPNTSYFQCEQAANSSLCDSTRFPYQSVEKALFEHIFSMEPSVEYKHSAKPIIDYQRVIDQKQQQINNLIDFIANGMASESIREKIGTLQTEIEELKDKIKKQPISSPIEQLYSRAYKLYKLHEVDGIEFDVKQNLRMTLRAEFQRLFDRIEISTHSHHDGNGTIFRRVWLTGPWCSLKNVDVYVVDVPLKSFGINGTRTSRRIKDGKVKHVDEVYCK